MNCRSALAETCLVLAGAILVAAMNSAATLPFTGDDRKENVPAQPLGIFEQHGDVGAVLHGGSVTFDPKTRQYRVAGSGDNMWFARDAFHYVWKKISGDVALTANVSWVGAGREPHRKACLIIRQSLDADAAYVDAALHGDGLTSLQFREARGAATHEIQ